MAQRPENELDGILSLQSPGGEQCGRERSASTVTGTAGATVTAGALTLNIITGGLGTGILSLPWSTAGATLVPALVIIALVLVVNKCTIMILVRAADKAQVFDLGSLLLTLGGQTGKISQSLCNVTVWVSMFLCLVGYMMAIADSFMKALKLHPKENESLFSPQTYVIAGAAIVILPLCFLDQKRLAFTSVAAVFVNIYIFVLLAVLMVTAVVEEHPEPPVPVPCFLGFGEGLISMITAMMQAVIIQMCCLPMYEELSERSPETFNRILNKGFSVLFVLFACFSAFAYFRWGATLEGNVLVNLPESWYGTVAQFGIIIVCCGVYPIMMTPLIAPIRSSPRLARFATVVTVVIELCSAAVAIVFKLWNVDLGFVNTFNGALQAGVFVGIIPALVAIQLLKKHQVAMSILAVVACAISVMGFIFTDNYVNRHEDFPETRGCLLPKFHNNSHVTAW